jgi:hypothetical protein
VISLTDASSWRRPADHELLQPAVHHVGVLDMREVAARVEPAHACARKALGGLGAMRRRHCPILPPVHEHHGQIQGGDGAAIRLAAADQLLTQRARGPEPGGPRRGRRAHRVVVPDEEIDLLGIGCMKARGDGGAIHRRAATERDELAESEGADEAMPPGQPPGEPRHHGAEQGQPVDTGGMGQRIRDRHRAAERMTHQRRLRHAEPFEKSVERAGEVREAVLGPRLARPPESRQIERVHGRARGERGDVVAPGGGESAQPVQKDDGGAAAFDEIVE